MVRRKKWIWARIKSKGGEYQGKGKMDMRIKEIGRLAA